MENNQNEKQSLLETRRFFRFRVVFFHESCFRQQFFPFISYLIIPYLKMSHSSLVLIDCIKIDDEILNELIQDKGVGPGEELFDKMKTRIYKAPDIRKYKDVWKLSKYFVDKMKSKKQRFPQ